MKRVIGLLCTLILCIGLLPVAQAANPDPAQSCSLTVNYSANGKSFPGLDIEIYRVAELRQDGQYKLLEPYSGGSIRIHGITSQVEWRSTAQNVRNFVISNQIPAYRTQKTNESGVAYFTDLETGLYMVKGVKIVNEKIVYTFRDFMIYVPTPSGGNYEYDVSAKPKFTETVEPDRYTVVKLWMDEGASENRPEAVTIDILRDGVVQESVVLNGENNWTYSWEVPDKAGEWSVMETNVPEGYQVSVTNEEMVFTVTNTKETAPPEDPDNPDPPDDPAPGVPDTGDTAPILMYLLIMCVSGFGMMILGIMRLRERHEKKR